MKECSRNFCDIPQSDLPWNESRTQDFSMTHASLIQRTSDKSSKIYLFLTTVLVTYLLFLLQDDPKLALSSASLMLYRKGKCKLLVTST